jgi:hypothetical protein
VRPVVPGSEIRIEFWLCIPEIFFQAGADASPLMILNNRNPQGVSHVCINTAKSFRNDGTTACSFRRESEV